MIVSPLLIGLGLLVGVFVGMTGVGGGALLTPLLILVVGIRPVIAVGTDLAFAAATKLVGACQHVRRGSADQKLTTYLALGSVPGALLGTLGIAGMERSNPLVTDVLLSRALGVMLLLAASVSLLRATGMIGERQSGSNPGAIVTISLGFTVGICVGLTSIGAGSLLMTVFSLFYRLPTARAVGTDVLHGALLATVAALAHGAAGRVELGMLVNLLVGSVPGVLVGGWLCTRLPSRPLRIGIAAMLAFSGAWLL